MVAIFAGVVVIAVYGASPLVRLGVLGCLVALVMAATWVQFREMCPRCATRIGHQTRLFLPPRCRHCGVAYTAPPPPEEAA
jgi:hypothetical protein